MSLVSAFRVFVIILSLILIHRISVSSRFKEATVKDGSLFVNYIMIFLLCTLISYLSYSFYPTITLYVNILLSIYFTPYSLLYQIIRRLFHKTQRIIFYYYDQFKVYPYLSLQFKFILKYSYKVICKFGSVIYDIYDKWVVKILSNSYMIWKNIMRSLYDVLYPMKEAIYGCYKAIMLFINNMWSYLCSNAKQILYKIKHHALSPLLRFSYHYLGKTAKVMTDYILSPSYKFIKRLLSYFWTNSTYFGSRLWTLVCDISSSINEMCSSLWTNINHYVHKISTVICDGFIHLKNAVLCPFRYINKMLSSLTENIWYYLNKTLQLIIDYILYTLYQFIKNVLSRIWTDTTYYGPKLLTAGYKCTVQAMSSIYNSILLPFWINIMYYTNKIDEASNNCYCHIMNTVNEWILLPTYSILCRLTDYIYNLFFKVMSGTHRCVTITPHKLYEYVLHPTYNSILLPFYTFICKTSWNIWSNIMYYMNKADDALNSFYCNIMNTINECLLLPIYDMLWVLTDHMYNLCILFMSDGHHYITITAQSLYDYVLYPIYKGIIIVAFDIFCKCCNKMVEGLSSVLSKIGNLILNGLEYIGDLVTKICKYIIALLLKLYDIICNIYDNIYDGMQYVIKLVLFYYSIYSSQIMLKKQHIDISINNRYATVKYEYNFENMSKYEKSEELKFEITINAIAFISGFIADIDGKMFVGETKEKKESTKQYQKAVKEDKNAILISKPYDNIPNVFRIKTNISRNSKVKLIITIEQYIEKMFTFNELTVELLNQFLAYNINNSFQYTTFNININENSGIYDFEIVSPKQLIINNEINNNTKYELDCKLKYDYSVFRKYNASELVLKYKLKGEENESYMIFDKKTDTFCHIISNNDIIDSDDNDSYFIPRRVVFIIDKSQSMKGMKWKQTINETIVALHNLRKLYDRYAIILFDDKLSYHDAYLLDVNERNITKSIECINNIKPSGATNINDALCTALEVIDNDRNKDTVIMNQLILITDGRPTVGVTDTNKILRNVKNLRRYITDSLSIYCFGIGEDNGTSWINDLNYSFLRELAMDNNGFHIRIKQSNTANNLNKYFKILSNPLLLDLNIKYEKSIQLQRNTNMLIKDVTKTSFDTLYHGSDIIICGKITDYDEADNNDNNNNDDTNEGSNKLKRIIPSEQCEGKTDDMLEDEEERKFDDNNSVDAMVTAKSGKLIDDNIKMVNIDKTISLKMSDIIENTLDENTENIERIWAYLNLQNSYKNKEKKDYENKQKQLDLAMKFKFVTPYTNMIVVEKNKNITNGPNIKRKIKLVVAGDYQCGKTSLLSAYTQNNHNINTSFFHKNVLIDNNEIDLEIWDIPNGQEKYQQFNLSPIYLRNVDGIIYVCSMNDRKSQNNIKKWMNNTSNIVGNTDINSILIINKSDLIQNDEDKHQVIEYIEALSNNLGIKYMTTSVKQNMNVVDAFTNILRSICNRLDIEQHDNQESDTFHENNNQNENQALLQNANLKRYANCHDDDDDGSFSRMAPMMMMSMHPTSRNSIKKRRRSTRNVRGVTLHKMDSMNHKMKASCC